MRRLTLATMATVLLLAGCTSGEGSDDTDATSTPGTPDSSTATPGSPGATAPDCDEVWKSGTTLPADYTTCLDGGESVSPDAVACTDDSSLVVHLDTFYAITGRKIVEPAIAPLQDTEEFGAAYATCTGE